MQTETLLWLPASVQRRCCCQGGQRAHTSQGAGEPGILLCGARLAPLPLHSTHETWISLLSRSAQTNIPPAVPMNLPWCRARSQLLKRCKAMGRDETPNLQGGLRSPRMLPPASPSALGHFSISVKNNHLPAFLPEPLLQGVTPALLSL